MSETCAYVFDPDEWNQGHQADSSVEEVWECPHETYVDHDYCIFHTEPEDRDSLGITEVDLRDELLRTVNEAPVEEHRFIGAAFGEVNLREQRIGAAEEPTRLDLRHATVDGILNLTEATVHGDFLGGCTTYQTVEAPNATFDGSATFRESDFENEVNFDSAAFQDDADFRRCAFDLKVEFSAADFQGDGDFRYSKFTDDALFQNTVFHEKGLFNSVRFAEANFTGADFLGRSSFANCTFTENVKFQYVSFANRSDFSDTKFTSNANFRGSSFQAAANFNGASFNGWATFRDTSFEADADFRNTWCKNKVTFVSESDNNAELDFTGSRLKKSEFKLSIYHPVFYDMSKCKVGNVVLDTDEEDQNVFNYVLFRQTTFNGFDFARYRDDLEENDWEIHKSIVHEDEPDLKVLQDTYHLAAEGAEGTGANDIASKFRKKKEKYRREREKEEGNTVGVISSYIKGLFG